MRPTKIWLFLTFSVCGYSENNGKTRFKPRIAAARSVKLNSPATGGCKHSLWGYLVLVLLFLPLKLYSRTDASSEIWKELYVFARCMLESKLHLHQGQDCHSHTKSQKVRGLSRNCLKRPAPGKETVRTAKKRERNGNINISFRLPVQFRPCYWLEGMDDAHVKAKMTCLLLPNRCSSPPSPCSTTWCRSRTTPLHWCSLQTRRWAS